MDNVSAFDVSNFQSTLHDSLVHTLPKRISITKIDTLSNTKRTILRSLLGINSLEKLYNRSLVNFTTNTKSNTSFTFYEAILSALNVTANVNRYDKVRVPKQGSLILCSNHPFGALDGIALIHEVKKIRDDVKVLANDWLSCIPELHDSMIFVNPFDDSSSASQNRSGVKKAIEHLNNGGILIVFPSGEVSSIRSNFRVEDSDWKTGFIRIAEATKAPILPCFVSGSNSVIFQLAGLVNPRLRTLMLLRELTNKENFNINISFGHTISPKVLHSFQTKEAKAKYVRERSYLLRHRTNEELIDTELQLQHQELITPIESHLLEQEISALDDNTIFYQQGDYTVYGVYARQIPHCMKELSRLREMTFRYIGEGTGKAEDTDQFDAWYFHLILWNSSTNEIVGSYRIGKCDEILSKVGKQGLYTSTLFRFGSRFHPILQSSCELGRSFVRVEYQRSYIPLQALWKAIGEFLQRNPSYRYLLGAVSISNDFSEPSKRLLIESLLCYHTDSHFKRMLKPLNGLPCGYFSNWDGLFNPTTVLPIDKLSDVLSTIELDGKGVPVLLRQYIALGAKVLGFNRDALFSNSIDVFCMFDTQSVNNTMLNRYLGKNHTRVQYDVA
jgi:putative hemolysin